MITLQVKHGELDFALDLGAGDGALVAAEEYQQRRRWQRPTRRSSLQVDGGEER